MAFFLARDAARAALEHGDLGDGGVGKVLFEEGLNVFLGDGIGETDDEDAVVARSGHFFF